MTKKNVTSLALAAGCALALAIPAAQAQSGNANGPAASGITPALNNAESAQYDRLLERSPAFRQARIRKECGPITDTQLRQNCFASFAQYEPSLGRLGRKMTGSSTGTMNSTTGTTGYRPDMTGPVTARRCRQPTTTRPRRILSAPAVIFRRIQRRDGSGAWRDAELSGTEAERAAVRRRRQAGAGGRLRWCWGWRSRRNVTVPPYQLDEEAARGRPLFRPASPAGNISSIAAANPSSSFDSVIAFAACLTASLALPIATPNPALRNISRSLSISPRTMISSRGTPPRRSASSSTRRPLSIPGGITSQ